MSGPADPTPSGGPAPADPTGPTADAEAEGLAAAAMAATAGAPDWFVRHLGVAPAEGVTRCGGNRLVRWLRWGEPAAAPLVLLHGGGAHARWWAPLAPFLSDEWCVIAPDLAGMGDSDWRGDGYRTEDWAADVLQVAADARATAVPGAVAAGAIPTGTVPIGTVPAGTVSDGTVPGGAMPSRADGDRAARGPTAATVPSGTDRRPLLLGHSLGATVAAVAGSLHPEALRAVLLCDIGLPRPGRSAAAGRAGRHFQNRITYPSAAEALSRFKLTPRQACPNDWYVEHIARTSLRPVGPGGPGDPTRPAPGGEVAWAWKFDWRVFARTVDQPFGEHLAALGAGPVPVACLYGEDSRVAPPELVARVAARLGPAPTLSIPDARHHLMVDQPIAFVTAVRALLDRLAG